MSKLPLLRAVTGQVTAIVMHMDPTPHVHVRRDLVSRTGTATLTPEGNLAISDWTFGHPTLVVLEKVLL
jgi:hypothetical protein